jgi:hypothetical protein
MPIKVLVKRRFKEGHVNEINKVIKEILLVPWTRKGT